LIFLRQSTAHSFLLSMFAAQALMPFRPILNLHVSSNRLSRYEYLKRLLQQLYRKFNSSLSYLPFKKTVLPRAESSQPEVVEFFCVQACACTGIIFIMLFFPLQLDSASELLKNDPEAESLFVS
jgi:hypothetical protein